LLIILAYNIGRLLFCSTVLDVNVRLNCISSWHSNKQPSDSQLTQVNVIKWLFKRFAFDLIYALQSLLIKSRVRTIHRKLDQINSVIL